MIIFHAFFTHLCVTLSVNEIYLGVVDLHRLNIGAYNIVMEIWYRECLKKVKKRLQQNLFLGKYNINK